MIQRFAIIGLLSKLINEPVLRELRVVINEIEKRPDGTIDKKQLKPLTAFVAGCELMLTAFPREPDDEVTLTATHNGYELMRDGLRINGQVPACPLGMRLVVKEGDVISFPKESDDV